MNHVKEYVHTIITFGLQEMRHGQFADGHVGIDIETSDLKKAVHAGVTKTAASDHPGVVHLSNVEINKQRQS